MHSSSYFVPTPKKKVLEACAIAAYHQSTDTPVVTTLLSDDAPQFKQIAYHHALCWTQDGRNYKKLRPIVPYHKEKLEAFLDNYWDFYGELCEFREKPDSEVAKQLSAKFDQLSLCQNHLKCFKFQIKALNSIFS